MSLSEQLHHRFMQGEGTVVRAADSTELAGCQPGEICHDNVARWLSTHQHKPLRGWLASNDSVFDKHSVIDTGNGWVDITPRTARARVRFLVHLGSENEFWAAPNQVIWPLR